MRIVADTNVLVSGLLNPKGPPGQILDLILEGDLEILIDDRILSEYRSVLREKELGIRREDVKSVLALLERVGARVALLPLSLELPDPDDVVFAEAARAGKAAYLVTGNLRHFPDISEAISPRGLIEHLSTMGELGK
ncbi:MAG: putative toxin-antitoxin system toxin component, PIN family [Armatimonadetes bacterium]|nr:putative toxin-antitoxin system toxin component, PIN family [Armatimonadota bacterium]